MTKATETILNLFLYNGKLAKLCLCFIWSFAYEMFTVFLQSVLCISRCPRLEILMMRDQLLEQRTPLDDSFFNYRQLALLCYWLYLILLYSWSCADKKDWSGCQKKTFFCCFLWAQLMSRVCDRYPFRRIEFLTLSLQLQARACLTSSVLFLCAYVTAHRLRF